MPGAKEPPPVPQRGPRKETVAGGFVVPRSEHQAPQGEAFLEAEESTARGIPHPFSEPPAPPKPSNPPPPDLAHRQSYADLAHEAAIAKAAAQDALAELATRRQLEEVAIAAKDARDRLDVANASKTLRVQYGGFRVGIPAVIVLGVVGLIVKAYLKHADDPPPLPPACVTKADYDRDLHELDRRLAPLETYYQFQVFQKPPPPAGHVATP